VSRRASPAPKAALELAAIRGLQPVASGPDSELLRGTWIPTGEPVAVKLLHRRITDDAGNVDHRAVLRRLTELQAVSASPGLAPVLHHGITADGRPFLVRPWSPQPALADELTRGPLSVDDTLRLALPVTRALAALHAAGLTHGNICPTNVLLVAGARSPALADAGLTGLAQLGGLAHFTVPSADTAPAADIYALGVTLAAALHLPPATTAAARDLPTASLELPVHLRRLLDQLTAPEPQWRPTAADVLDELQALTASETVHDDQLGPPPPAPVILDEPADLGTQPSASAAGPPANEPLPPPDDDQWLAADWQPAVPATPDTAAPAELEPSAAAAATQAFAVGAPAAAGPDAPARAAAPSRRRQLVGVLAHRRSSAAVLTALAVVAVAAVAVEELTGHPRPRAAAPAAVPATLLLSPAGSSLAASPAATTPATPTPPPAATTLDAQTADQNSGAKTAPASTQQRAPTRSAPRPVPAAPPAAPAAPAVPAPTGLRVAAGNGALAASWNAPATAPGAPPIVSYNLTVRRIADGATETINVPVVNPGAGIYQAVPGLANNLAYTVTVTAIDQAGHTSPPVSAGPVIPHP
jgi:hypothetical protein